MSTQIGETREARLGAVLASCIEAAERGERPDRERLLAEHPEFARELASYFDCRTRLDEFAMPLRDAAGATSSAAPPCVVGDFELIREIGRGGMGVVYEARQQSLRRRVALKILPLAAVLDDRRLERFKNEALAAAQLKHPNIVSVLAVGCDRGVHHYAMEYIEGASVADVIRDLHGSDHAAAAAADHRTSDADRPVRDTVTAAGFSTLPSSRQSRDFYRNVARLGIEAAEALENAHQIGIVHRDVKPSNLLLDHDGRLYVADFGLAMTAADSNLTQSGDLMGTLRYMSPEQAAGRRRLVDHRTDIYSLGATLYELALGQPVLGDVDPARLLTQVATEPPRPPRYINPAIPRDLETILLKSLAKQPADRYDTAQGLADDLKRFVNHEPIHARRTGSLVRVTKWSQRHRHLVASVIVVLFLAVVGLATSVLLIADQRDAAEAAADEAAEQHERAEKHRTMAVEAIDAMLTQLEEEVADQPQMEQLHRRLLNEGLRLYEGFLEEAPTSPRVRFETARVHARIADIAVVIGDVAKALEHRLAAKEIARELSNRFPKEAKYRKQVAEFYSSAAKLLLNMHREHGDAEVLDEAESYMKAARTAWQQLAAQDPANPDFRHQIALWHLNRLHHHKNKSGPLEGVRQVLRGLELLNALEREFPSYPKDRGARGEAHYLLGIYLQHLRRYAEAEWHFRCARKMQGYELNTFRLARLLLMRGAADEAKPHLSKFLEVARREAALHPATMSKPRRHLMHCLWTMHHILLGLEQWEDAEAVAREELEISRDRYHYTPENPQYREHFADSIYDLGNVLFAAGSREEAATLYQQAVPMYEELAGTLPANHRIQSQLAYVLSSCPVKELRNPQLAIEAAQAAIDLEPAEPDYWTNLAMAQYELGSYTAAVRTLEKARVLFDPTLPSRAHLVLAMAYHQHGDPRRGEEIYRQVTHDLDHRNVYSEWFRTEFRVLRADADRLFLSAGVQVESKEEVDSLTEASSVTGSQILPSKKSER